jgi:predicted SprT family Zn-dependent metalloprotease
MTKRTISPVELVQSLEKRTSMVWDMLCEGYPKLTRYDPPKIELNNRLWRCAGLAFAREGQNRVQLATKFFLFSAEYEKMMYNVILPHEVIHIADYRVFGECEKKCGHGKKWAEMMVYYGLPAAKFHSMEIPQSFHIKQVNTK